ncbi:MAG: YdeI/OmpD-associated family protein [Planctomycetes bacterium]|nr:YdeI/OmpD-associated family protein [Planctomycetota bacterium]
MGTRDPRVDTYIRKSAAFARPILERLREDVHACCPDVVETIKWSMPAFEYKGLLCGLAAFKGHCTFGFWKHALVVGDDPKADEAMGSFGRITSVADLPKRSVFRRYMRKAMRLNERGVTAPREKARPRSPIPMHPAFKRALAGNGKAAATFEAFPPSHRREYLEWIAEAKQETTRARRIGQAVDWLAAGKPRNWKHMKR